MLLRPFRSGIAGSHCSVTAGLRLAELNSKTFFSCGHRPDLFEFWALDAKVSRHLYDLFGVDKVFGVRAKLFHSGAKFTASHTLRDLEAEAAFSILLILQTEFTNYHCALF
jgi:hypothetical protein